jgi:predicted nicotinamide N-methyase
MKTAIELDIFTAIGEGANTAVLLAQRISVSQRGADKLCNYMTMLGFLQKRDGRYALGEEAAAFLDRRSSAYLGAPASEASTDASQVEAFAMLTQAVRRGGTALAGGGTLAPEHPIWVAFARAAAGPGAHIAKLLADVLAEPTVGPAKVLDIAGGHGLYGIELAKRNPQAEVFAVEWPQVLALARVNAQAAGVLDRFHPIPGDALGVEFGLGYDLALITNFLPDLATTERLLVKVRSALIEHGRVVLLESMLNDDRVSPAAAVALDLTLLATTPSGETRTAAELGKALENAGFTRVEMRGESIGPGRIAIGYRQRPRRRLKGRDA